ncbi:hypothetical protein [Streptomyces sp. MNP-20]|uniref:hypothetical protein n=1 Tax=Streptomyces sp. MNP-20 TaxID=2721165 RepID=UPI0015570225|nr:hypothetical protein [Streptomyces sp. MNP-20]
MAQSQDTDLEAGRPGLARRVRDSVAAGDLDGARALLPAEPVHPVADALLAHLRP